MDPRTKMKEDIFIVLTELVSRDSKNNYCSLHAMERAIVIENSIYKNCCKMGNLEKIYQDIDIKNLVNKLEEKTRSCIYNIGIKT